MDEFIENEVRFNWEEYFKQLCRRAERLGGKLKETEEGYKIMLPIPIKPFKTLIDVDNCLYIMESELIDKLSEELGF